MTTLPPLAAARQVTDLFARSAPRLFADLAAAGLVPAAADARGRARGEWECFALFGCVRGIVAASGFAPRTAETIDALHEAVLATGEAPARRALLARRYQEYETIAQAGGASGAGDVATRLGAAAAAHLEVGDDAAADAAGILGAMHEALAEAVVALLSGEAALAGEPAIGAGPGAAALPPGIAAPPLAGAWRIVERLEAAGVTCALGGSGLLAALGLAREVRDWDLTTDAPRERVEAALAGVAYEHIGSDALHADEKFMVPALELEIIRGFAFFTPGGVVRVPTRVTRRWAGLPVGSPECWAAAYHLLGRSAKRDRLLEWLRGNGADRSALAALLAQPLPRELAEALGSLLPPGTETAPFCP